jgi:prevent-host-death family protein
MVVNIHEAKTHLSRLLQQVAAGEEVIIAPAGVPVTRLVAIEPEPKKVRPLGFAKGEVCGSSGNIPSKWSGAENSAIEKPPQVRRLGISTFINLEGESLYIDVD